MNELQQKTAQAIVNIFETGKIRGDYAAITVLKGDRGHLSYGRSQASLGSGALFRLLQSYCSQPDARYAAGLRPFLPRFKQRDISLDKDSRVQQVLKDAGENDPVMRRTQDQFFQRSYLVPALAAAEAFGVTEALGQAVVYDSYVQGGWGRLKDRIGPVVGGNVRSWVNKYLDLRTTWLKSLKPPLPSTVYRMDAFRALIRADKWDLALPIDVRGVTITLEALSEDPPVGALQRTLLLTQPYLQGQDVAVLQRALAHEGLPAKIDAVYGPATHHLVLQWQADHGVHENGVGPATRSKLGI